MRGSRVRRHSPLYLTPSPSPREMSPRPSSVFADGDEQLSKVLTRPRLSPVFAPPPPLSMAANASLPPSLNEIMSNTAPPPWTLSAFMAYLSQNHCLETLEFVMDAERYRTAHAHMAQRKASWVAHDKEKACKLWEKLMHAYILPYGSREVNLPATVRDRLLSQTTEHAPPDPSELDDAVRIIYELMNDSLLGPFIESVSPVSRAETSSPEPSHDKRQSRARIRLAREVSAAFGALPLTTPASPNETSNRSPTSVFGTRFGGRNSVEPFGHSVSPSGDPVLGFFDDRGSLRSQGSDPMTPPTTPPASDLTMTTTASGLQRAISTRASGWKKMGAKLVTRMGKKRADVTSGILVPVAGGSRNSSNSALL